ncbi:polysaccharide deacetylase [Mesobacillus maritimus]|uniref:Polysaccharide deacetylase n=2 Tax=Mesobacillus maritimus TaxID=1643336 RepID=A0ABS7K6R0_9BACI|nr:polysaccharide deacetylase family protein [Mesobacillus maritimus]MBY0097969.1 polysaccharide deacetylase [Mesobacillus maritimus]
MIVLLSGILGNNVKEAAKENKTKIQESLETLSFYSEPMAALADSTLSQSIIEKNLEEHELARLEAFAKQNEQDQRENVIYLTFDDGPSQVSHQLLDILDDYDMKATHFMIGPNIQKYPEAVKKMNEDGHGLALHGMTHNVKKIYGSSSAPLKEMTKTMELVEDVTGVSTQVVRLPYGSFPYLTEEMRYVLTQHDFTVWDWNVDTLDWEFQNQRYVQHSIQEIQKLKQKGETPIVLLHDKPQTVKHLPKLLSYIKKQGYKTKVLTNEMAPITFPCNGRCVSIK